MDREDIIRLGERVSEGERLEVRDAVHLFSTRWISELGAAALELESRINPASREICTFVIDININYTNICETRCAFCAFHRGAGDRDAYVRSIEDILEAVGMLVRYGGTQVMLQGGHNPDLGFDYYLELLREVRRAYPVHIHSFSPSEVWYMSRRFDMDIECVLRELVNAGLNSLPGGGAEILVPRVRRRISPRKVTGETWLEVMRVAQEMGIPTTATMVYGHAESYRDRVEHLDMLRRLQEETMGFTAFIPWSYQPGGTALGGSRASLLEYLKVVAVSRLMLDNIPHVQAGWLTEGGGAAQLALSFGASDLGGTLFREEVVRSAGGEHWLHLDDILRLIRGAGRVPVQRDTYYRHLRRYDG